MGDHADDENDHGHTKAISHNKVDYWAGYYDFLINEGSYKFWAVFQVIRKKSILGKFPGLYSLFFATYLSYVIVRFSSPPQPC